MYSTGAAAEVKRHRESLDSREKCGINVLFYSNNNDPKSIHSLLQPSFFWDSKSESLSIWFRYNFFYRSSQHVWSYLSLTKFIIPMSSKKKFIIPRVIFFFYFTLFMFGDITNYSSLNMRYFTIDDLLKLDTGVHAILRWARVTPMRAHLPQFLLFPRTVMVVITDKRRIGQGIAIDWHFSTLDRARIEKWWRTTLWAYSAWVEAWVFSTCLAVIIAWTVV